MGLYERAMGEAMSELHQLDKNQSYDDLVFKHEKLAFAVQRAIFELEHAGDPSASKTLIIINVKKILEDSC